MKPTFVDAFSRSVTLSPETSALLIIDMQNATGNRTMGLGALLEAQGMSQASSYRFDRIDHLLVPNISRLAATCRDVGVRVIYITYGSNLPDFSDMPAHMAGIVRATNNVQGRPEHEIIEALAPQPGELVVNKTTQGAFRSTGIDTHLRAMGIETVISVGVSTNNCVAMTSMEACEAQYGVVVVSDGTGTDSEPMQQATLTMLQRLWARVMTTDEIIAELTSGGGAMATP